MSLSTLDVTAQLAAFVHRTRLADIPQDVQAIAKVAIADSLCTVRAGLNEPAVKILREVISAESRDGKSLVLGTGKRLSATGAAFINAATAHALDYDNISLIVSGFVSTPVLYALLAVCEERGIGGEKLLEAFIVGSEAEAAVARGLGVEHYACGWHATATLGHIGAAVACAKLLDFDELQIRRAIGFAATDASGLRATIGNMTNPYHLGKAARCGPLAVALIERGFTAHEDVLEYSWGFCNAFNGPGKFNLQAIVDGLGAPYDLINPGLVLKLYPCCGLIHSALDGVLDLVAEHKLQTSQIRKVRLAVHDLVLKTMDRKAPTSAYEGKFCAPFCVALALKEGNVKIAHFTDEATRDPELLELMSRVEATVHPELTTFDSFLEKEFSDVTIDLVDGRSVSCRVWRAANRGSRDRPATPADLRDKYIETSRTHPNPAAAIAALESVAHIEQIKDLGKFLEVL